MKPNYRCSICAATFTRNWNANRHSRNIHDGNAQVLPLNGSPTRGFASHLDNKPQRDVAKVHRLYWTEFIREMARLNARKQYKSSGSKIIAMICLLNDAAKNYTNPPSSSTSMGKLINTFIGLESDDVHGPRETFIPKSIKDLPSSISIKELLK